MSDGRFASVLSAQPRRFLHALSECASVDADPIVRSDERLESGEYATLCYELHHVHLPELEADGVVAFDREADEVRRGPAFEASRPSADRVGGERAGSDGNDR